MELDRDPTAALAYARKSLEMADTGEARTFAVEALWRAPSARIVPLPEGRTSWRAAFAPDGKRFAAYTFSPYVMLYDDDGSPPRDLGGFSQPSGPPPSSSRPRATSWPPAGSRPSPGVADNFGYAWCRFRRASSAEQWKREAPALRSSAGTRSRGASAF